jgi:DNA-binding transcriptional ArsR family regulator
MSYLILKDRKSNQLIPAHVLHDPAIAQSILQPMRWRILSQLITRELCAKDLAKTLGTSEQVICYHLKELEKADFIRLEKTERRRGAVAKYYRAEHKAVAVVPDASRTETSRLSHFQPLSELSTKMLEPFVSEGRLNAYIVLGNPDAHGIFNSGARCGDRATDLALFLGSLLPLTRESVVRLDTEISQQDLLRNLILIGSPRVNTVTMMVNEWLSITYELTGRDLMLSSLTGNSYAGNEGSIQVIPNPMNQESRVIVIAGNNYSGTRAAILAFIRYTDEIAKGNSTNPSIVARVVSGLDMDNDGLFDDVEFLE